MMVPVSLLNSTRVFRSVKLRAQSISVRSAQSSSQIAVKKQIFTITTPLYYANAEPHMGGAYSTIAADVIARFQRMQGKEVHFVTGTDEHGEKIAASAAFAGESPQEHCDKLAARYQELWRMLDIEYTSFVRTTDAKHEVIVRSLLSELWPTNDIVQAAYSGRYCVGCEEYKDDEDLEDGALCPIHKTPCPVRDEENYFFKLSHYSTSVQEFIGATGAVQPERAANEVRQWIADGCRDFSISRANVDWGIRVPGDSAQTVYVWFDALIGYLSALLPPGVPASKMALQQHGWPADVHVIGKDILRFHAVYWPGMLSAMGLPLPRKLYAHGFLTKDGTKMGKSLGNVLDPFALTDAYGADAVRFYFMSEIPFGQDGDFSEKRFQDIVNSALANNFGNLVNRCLNLLNKNCSGVFPVMSADVAVDHPMRIVASTAVPTAREAYDSMAIHEGATAALSIVRRANTLLDKTAPWTALKKGSDSDKLAAVETIVAVLEGARIAAVLLAPVTPALAARVLRQLAVTSPVQDLRWEAATQWGGLRAGTAFPKPAPVFLRIAEELVL